MRDAVKVMNTGLQTVEKFEFMTLKEITDLLDVRHNDAMEIVERMATGHEFGEIRKFRSSYTNNIGATLPLETYKLDKRQSVAVAARLNTAMLMRVIDRWQELESNVDKRLPTTFAEALRLAADLEEQKLALEQKITLDAPKVQFAEDVEQSEDSFLIGALAKVFGIKPRAFFELLRQEGFIDKKNVPYQKYIIQGLFVVKETPYQTSSGTKINLTPMITGKGQLYFHKKFFKDKL